MAFEGGCTSNNVSIKVLSASKRDSVDKKKDKKGFFVLFPAV